MTLYLSPDQTFLLPELLDVRIDPLEEERRKNGEVMASLVQGRLSSMGPADAKVTIVEFSDFQCPYCRQSAGMLKTFLATPEAKDVRFVFRHFPLTMHPGRSLPRRRPPARASRTKRCSGRCTTGSLRTRPPSALTMCATSCWMWREQVPASMWPLTRVVSTTRSRWARF